MSPYPDLPHRLNVLHRTLDHLAAILEDDGMTRTQALDKLESARVQLQNIEFSWRPGTVRDVPETGSDIKGGGCNP